MLTQILHVLTFCTALYWELWHSYVWILQQHGVLVCRINRYYKPKCELFFNNNFSDSSGGNLCCTTFCEFPVTLLLQSGNTPLNLSSDKKASIVTQVAQETAPFLPQESALAVSFSLLLQGAVYHWGTIIQFKCFFQIESRNLYHQQTAIQLFTTKPFVYCWSFVFQHKASPEFLWIIGEVQDCRPQDET